MKFSILGPGGIAQSLAETVSKLDGIEAYAVASRDYGRAKAFADKWGYKKAYGSYEEMMKDPEVELVYIATPHSNHYEYAKMCLENGKHILVEKAFTVNAKQAKEILELSKEKNLLVAEAMWTRYMPGRKMVDDLIESGVIGEPCSMTSAFGFPLTHVERLMSPDLAGGALLDLTVYPITAALMVFKEEIKEIHTTAVMSDRGVDLQDSVTLIFENGKMAMLHTSMLDRTACESIISGTKGFLKLHGVNNPGAISVYNAEGEFVETYKVPEQINGYEYEVLACKEAIEAGMTECPQMPHSEILRVMELMDTIRGRWGMTFPCE